MDRIKLLRLQNNVTQAELGKYLNVKSNTISRYENGSREPDIDVVLKIADYFHVTTDYLFGKSDEQVQSPDREDDLNYISQTSRKNPFARQFISGLKSLLNELDLVSNEVKQAAEIYDFDPEMQYLYEQLDVSARYQVKGYIHRLLEEKDT